MLNSIRETIPNPSSQTYSERRVGTMPEDIHLWCPRKGKAKQCISRVVLVFLDSSISVLTRNTKTQ
jgi:hypothetical protein